MFSRLFNGLRNLIRRERARAAGKKLDAKIEAQRIAQLRQEAGTEEVDQRVANVETQLGDVVTKPDLEHLERMRTELQAQERARGQGQGSGGPQVSTPERARDDGLGR